MASTKRVKVPGSLSYVTCWGTELRPLFRGPADYRAYLRLLRAHTKSHWVHVHAYCLLPRQAHLLLETSSSDVSRAMQSLNTSYALYSNRRHRQTGHVFARPYTLVLVEKNRYMLDATRRIHLLPAVAGLVDDASTYPWSSIGTYLGLGADPAVRTSEVLRLLPGSDDPHKTYARYLTQPGPQAWSPEGRGSKAVGSDAFHAVVEHAGALRHPRRPPIQHAAAAAARHYGMPLEALLTGRSRDHVRRRQVLLYVATTFGGYSMHQLGRLCGRSPSTVHYAVRRVAALPPDSPEAHEVRALADALFPSATIERIP
jgi:putative transposase